MTSLPMNHRVALTITSLLSIVLFSFHWVDEISRGMETAGLAGLGGVGILGVWLSGTLIIGQRRSGLVIMLVGAILGVGVLVVHMKAGLLGGRIATNSPGAFFWVWTLIALGVSSTICLMLAVLSFVVGPSQPSSRAP